MTVAPRPDAGAAPARSKAWTCLLVNAFVCPGLGSLMGKKLLSGIPQLILAWGGALWMIWMLIQYLHSYIQAQGVPSDWRYYRDSALGGACFFLAGWLWSVATGWALVRTARQNAPLPAP
jgi:hypothetical protein